MSKAPKNPKVICQTCGWYGHSADRLVADDPFNPGSSLFGCPRCRECYCFVPVCDELDCWQPVTRSDSASAAGRSTCNAHWPRGGAEMSHPSIQVPEVRSGG